MIMGRRSVDPETLEDRTQIANAVASLSLDPSQLTDAFIQANGMASDLARSSAHQRAVLLKLVKQIQISEIETAIEVGLDALLHDGLDHDSCHVIQAPISFREHAGETKLVILAAENSASRPDPALVKAVARAHVWFDELSNGKSKSVIEIANREGVTDRYLSQILQLAFVAPSVVEEILQGRNSRAFTTRRLTLEQSLPALWKDQMVS